MEASPPSLARAKKALRSAVLARRAALGAAERRAATVAIEKRLFALDAYRRAHAVMAYTGFGAEIDTGAILEALLWSGKMLVLPRVDRDTKTLCLHRVESLDDLVPGVWDIREPRADLPVVPLETIDLVLMPGVAFDTKGNRLGYGAGYYDRLLANTRGWPEPRPLRVAATFDCQIVDAVPVSPTDQPIHILITESRLLELRP